MSSYCMSGLINGINRSACAITALCSRTAYRDGLGGSRPVPRLLGFAAHTLDGSCM